MRQEPDRTAPRIGFGAKSPKLAIGEVTTYDGIAEDGDNRPSWDDGYRAGFRDGYRKGFTDGRDPHVSDPDVIDA